MNELQKMILKELHIKPNEKFKVSSKTAYFHSGTYLINDDMYVYNVTETSSTLLNNSDDFIMHLIRGNIIIKTYLTEEEIITLKALKINGYKYIARDDIDILLYAYKEKPIKTKNIWSEKSNCYFKLNFELFSFIKWEDKEPIKIEYLLRNV